MNILDRRAFLGGSAAAVAVLGHPESALAQAAACPAGPMPAFSPARLTVDCASRRNFASFRKNSLYMGLTGVVSMSFAQGKYGGYQAGNLFLFPWLKKKGLALGAAKDWQTVLPTSATKFISSAPIKGWTLPLDEYFCRYVIQAPYTTFIGFRVDVPVNINDARRPWFTNVDKLADGKPVSVAWNSSNLNGPWFGGSRWIPNTDTCNGNAWRTVILDGLSQASTAIC
jgi:hypothetical protein